MPSGQPSTRKLGPYEHAGETTCSKATHGFEAWQLTPSNVMKLKQWCARRLAVITGNDIATEYKFPSYDLVAALRVHRLRWLGHVLRMDSSVFT